MRARNLESYCHLLIASIALSGLPTMMAEAGSPLQVVTPARFLENGPSDPEDQPCTIKCTHNTTCVKGELDVSWHPMKPGTDQRLDFHQELSRGGYHCDCPPGRTGLRCARSYSSCGDGTHVCYNGGRCIDGLKDIYQNDQLFCDCEPQEQADGTVKKYSGKYCEVEVSSHEHCASNENFCKNGAVCKLIPDEADPCDCTEGYAGRHCEYVANTVPNCTLSCENGGVCRLGTKKEAQGFVRGPQTPEEIHDGNYQYCDCPQGYGGLHCKRRELKCGDLTCLHGGACVETLLTDTGDSSFHCDCGSAGGRQKRYAGRECEIESTSVCTYDDDSLESTFCTNDGDCPLNAHGRCSCPAGLTGAHCEFTKAEAQEHSYANCHLKCRNGGECRKGIKKESPEDFSQYGADLHSLALNVTHSEDFEHCACPKGYVGLECEYKYIPCGDGHPCFHGSECIMVEGEPTCLCASADTRAAGIYCQHLATNMCPSQDPTVDAAKGIPPNFCVNSGSCVTNMAGEAVCRCHKGFEGDHCEFLVGTAPKAVIMEEDMAVREDDTRSLSGGGKFAISMAVFVGVAVMIMGYFELNKRRYGIEDLSTMYSDKKKQEGEEFDNSVREQPVVDKEDNDFMDGFELKDVEFI